MAKLKQKVMKIKTRPENCSEISGRAISDHFTSEPSGYQLICVMFPAVGAVPRSTPT